MRDLNRRTAAASEKRPPGNYGRKAGFLTNITKLSMFRLSLLYFFNKCVYVLLGLEPNVAFLKYDMRMYVVYKGEDDRGHLKDLTKQKKDHFPKQQRTSLTVLVYKHIIESYPDVFPKDLKLFCDRRPMLFSAYEQIKLATEKEEFIIPASNLSSACGYAEKVSVVIKKVSEEFQVSSNDVMKAVDVRDIERDKNILELLNLVVPQEGYLETTIFLVSGPNKAYLFDHGACCSR
ncbi:hypothetical protein DICVIV_13924 [Dictyocaulus viviparus]|uniref:Uncharacterized protein n=1 Tax=Dictyocaulus viviparus TaxID=29172 RepID=A0A0D8XCF3_DICVI|nr:hypothetical protein DICVIV_13924 [Dictyocaulus viviparus]